MPSEVLGCTRNNLRSKLRLTSSHNFPAILTNALEVCRERKIKMYRCVVAKTRSQYFHQCVKKRPKHRQIFWSLCSPLSLFLSIQRALAFCYCRTVHTRCHGRVARVVQPYPQVMAFCSVSATTAATAGTTSRTTQSVPLGRGPSRERSLRTLAHAGCAGPRRTQDGSEYVTRAATVTPLQDSAVMDADIMRRRSRRTPESPRTA